MKKTTMNMQLKSKFLTLLTIPQLLAFGGIAIDHLDNADVESGNEKEIAVAEERALLKLYLERSMSSILKAIDGLLKDIQQTLEKI